MPSNNADITFKYGNQNTYDSVEQIDDNAIYITTDTHRIYIGGVDYTEDTQMNDNTKQYVDSSVNNVNSRIDNIIAHNNDTEGNSELVDIRTGVDSTVYASAGAAVREQISDTKHTLEEHQKDIVKLCGHIFYDTYTFGAINSGTNEDAGSSKNRIRTALPIQFYHDMRIRFNSIPRPIWLIWLNSNNERISSTQYITAESISLDNYAPDNTASFRFFIKYDETGTQEFTDSELRDIPGEIEIIKPSLSDDIAECKAKLPFKVDKTEISVTTASETSSYAKGTDFSVFSSFLADSNRYVSDYVITKKCFLTALTVPTGAATACSIICGEVKNNVFTMHHDYGSFTITDGTAQINDTRYVLKPEERVFIKFTGGFHYKSDSTPCVFLTSEMAFGSLEHYMIGYDLLLTDTEESVEWLKSRADMIGNFRGKNYVAYGDSITAGYDLPGYDENSQFNNTSVNVYSKHLADDLKMNYFNYGYSAHGYSVTPNYTFATLIERHHTNADVVTVAMGTNDYGLAGTYNIPFGTLSDTTAATFCGSVRASYDKLLEYYPKAEIIIILPLPRSNMTANAQGKTLYDYADVIKQIAGEYGFPVVDLLREGNVHHKSTAFMNAYSMDGLHWNESFHKEYIYPQIKNTVINKAKIS